MPEPFLRQRFRALNEASSCDAAKLAAQGKRAGLWRLVLAPFCTFVRTYLWQGGWRNGIGGLVSAFFAAYKVFVCYAKLWERQHGKRSVPPSPEL